VANQHSVWIGVGVLVGLAVLAAQAQRSREPLAARGEALARVSSVRPSPPSSGDVAALRSELEVLRAQVNARPDAALSAASSPPPTIEPGAVQPTAAQARHESEQRWRDHMAEVAFSFAQEARDGRWAAATSQVVSSALNRNATLAGMAGPIDCRSTSCRVEIERDAGGAVEKELPIFLNSLASTLPVAEADHEEVDGKFRYTLYLKTAEALAARAPEPATN
jgi:hypothetical protein